MTGPEHYKEAERLIAIAAKLSMETVQHAKDNGADAGEMQVMAAHSANFLAEAQVHATLALAAAYAIPNAGQMPVEDCDAWEDAAGADAAIARHLAAADREHEAVSDAG